MDCPQDALSADIEYLHRFRRKTVQNRVPLTGSIDLTYRCNFQCVHCYIGDRSTQHFAGQSDLDTNQWLRIIDEIVEAGCLYLLISGGDPLLRRDFCEIYTYARTRGLIITIFTNGTTLSEEILATWKQYPPRMVEITLYGATEETCSRVTGQKNALALCLRNAVKLLENKICIGLKTILMTLNLHEFRQMEEIAARLGVRFRHDGDIFPRFDGDHSVTMLRVDPETIAEIDFSAPDRAKEWSGYYARMKTADSDDRLYKCGSGVVNFHITPDGMLQPCIMCRSISHNLLESSFKEGWQNTLPRIQEIKFNPESRCLHCDKKHLCDFCPAFSELENGNNSTGPEYLCRLGNYRFQHIMNMAKQNENQ